MIVRISGEGQYRVEDADATALNGLENALVEVVEGGHEDRFAAAFAALLDHVRANGVRLGDEELEGSDLILPPPDISFAEAAAEFTGEGLIPD
jgi:hypothetical protein